MKKTYTTPKIEKVKINSEAPITAFAAGNINSVAMVKADSTVTNVINY
ncbi:MAG: hypothetical protein LUC92_09105 [Clostridiales bacterium]|nr:hypothetical protein [Clostridiales bacterium]